LLRGCRREALARNECRRRLAHRRAAFWCLGLGGRRIRRRSRGGTPARIFHKRLRRGGPFRRRRIHVGFHDVRLPHAAFRMIVALALAVALSVMIAAAFTVAPIAPAAAASASPPSWPTFAWGAFERWSATLASHALAVGLRFLFFRFRRVVLYLANFERTLIAAFTRRFLALAATPPPASASASVAAILARLRWMLFHALRLKSFGLVAFFFLDRRRRLRLRSQQRFGRFGGVHLLAALDEERYLAGHGRVGTDGQGDAET